MSNKPIYNWDWFDSHDPFKKILEETCDLEIEKEIRKVPVFGWITRNENVYRIKVNLAKFEQNISDIKSELMETRVYKNSEEVREWFNELFTKTDKNKRILGSLITEGCIKWQGGGRYEWDWMVNEQ